MRRPSRLTPNAEADIKRLFCAGSRRKREENISIDLVLGPYGGNFAVLLRDITACGMSAIITKTVGGVAFDFFGSADLYIYDGNELIYFPDAYEKGLLSRDDLLSLSSVFSRNRSKM